MVSPAALSFMLDCWDTDPSNRPTADTLLRAPFAFQDSAFNWYDTDLYQKLSTKPKERVGNFDAGA